MAEQRRRRKKKTSSVRSVVEIFADASPTAVEQAGRRLRRWLRYKRWLPSTNVYLHQAPTAIEAQFGKRKSPLTYTAGEANAKYLSEYIAASTVLHCADGWAYLGRAMSAQLRGDSGATRHFAYYAELRAAVSILSSQGVGVFSRIHALVTEDGGVQLYRQDPTHKFAWLALSKWSELTQSVEVLGDVIRPADVPLTDWLTPLGGSAVWAATGRRYLHWWGYDIERFGADQDARNDSSYQPRTTFGANPPSSERALEFGSEFWRAFEPDGLTNFAPLDRYLLRRTMKRLFESQQEKKAEEHPEDFRRFFMPALEDLQTTESEAQLSEFFLASSSQEPPLFAEAEQESSIQDPEDHLRVVARAALLLRVASGTAKHLLREADLSYGEYEWWARQIGATRALAVEDAATLATPELLWGDVDAAIDALEMKGEGGSAVNYTSMNGVCARELATLGGCERIALWALAT
jgi:hypothetical protein